MKVRLLSHGPAKGSRNMAVDEAILRSCARGDTGPTLRFYQWDPACLSLGYFQDLSREVDVEALPSLGVDLVRRLTGGKAVLHDDEITYSVVVPEKMLPGSVLETYRRISQALVEGLRLMGIPAAIAALERGVTSRDPRFRQAACFSAPSWFEILWDGKKLIGSAQNRKNGVILQHGSIPFRFDAAKLVKCLKTSSPEHAERSRAMLQRKAAGIFEALGRDCLRTELEEHLKAGFGTALGWRLEPGNLTQKEEDETLRLIEKKYGCSAWTRERGRQDEELH
ncbi:MAG: lipoate--protein ligase family protein [Bacillota bacterium]|jgi:lipoate-protein ligase A|nr:lipoate--protein ligase family protein [Candidatus Fermentithermobacillaceae bacterium]